MSLEAAERAVREGDLDAALANLQEQIRKNSAKADLLNLALDGLKTQ